MLEGMTLTAIFQGSPTFASAVLLLKAAGGYSSSAEARNSSAFSRVGKRPTSR
jgi:hypothetical protein